MHDGAQAEDLGTEFEVVGNQSRGTRCTNSFSQRELLYPDAPRPLLVMEHRG